MFGPLGLSWASRPDFELAENFGPEQATRRQPAIPDVGHGLRMSDGGVADPLAEFEFVVESEAIPEMPKQQLLQPKHNLECTKIIINRYHKYR